MQTLNVSVNNEYPIRGLYHGTAATLLRDIPFSMVYFSLYGRLRRYFTDETGHIAAPKILLASTIAGLESLHLTSQALYH